MGTITLQLGDADQAALHHLIDRAIEPIGIDTLVHTMHVAALLQEANVAQAPAQTASAQPQVSPALAQAAPAAIQAPAHGGGVLIGATAASLTTGAASTIQGSSVLSKLAHRLMGGAPATLPSGQPAPAVQPAAPAAPASAPAPAPAAQPASSPAAAAPAAAPAAQPATGAIPAASA